MILKSPTILVSNQRIFLSLNIRNCKSVRKLGATIFVYIHINKKVVFFPANLRHIIHKAIIAEDEKALESFEVGQVLQIVKEKLETIQQIF